MKLIDNYIDRYVMRKVAKEIVKALSMFNIDKQIRIRKNCIGEGFADIYIKLREESDKQFTRVFSVSCERALMLMCRIEDLNKLAIEETKQVLKEKHERLDTYAGVDEDLDLLFGGEK